MRVCLCSPPQILLPSLHQLTCLCVERMGQKNYPSKLNLISAGGGLEKMESFCFRSLFRAWIGSARASFVLKACASSSVCSRVKARAPPLKLSPATLAVTDNASQAAVMAPLSCRRTRGHQALSVFWEKSGRAGLTCPKYRWLKIAFSFFTRRQENQQNHPNQTNCLVCRG